MTATAILHTNSNLGHSYSRDTGAYQKEYRELYLKLVPPMGDTKTRNGQLLRYVSNLNYEYFNNGNYNTAEILGDNPSELIAEASRFWQHKLEVIARHVPEVKSACDEILDFWLEADWENQTLGDCYFSSKELKPYNDMTDHVLYFILNNPDEPLSDTDKDEASKHITPKYSESDYYPDYNSSDLEDEGD